MNALISELALLARVNRKLTPRNSQLKRCQPGSRHYEERGHFYHTDLATGRVLADHLDIEAFAREVGALRDWEALER